MSDTGALPASPGRPGATPAAGTGLTSDPDTAPEGAGRLVPGTGVGREPHPGFAMGPVGGPPGGGPGALLPQVVPPGFILNPAFVQWQQLAQAWRAERTRRQDQFLSACRVIRRDAATGYAIDIEADSTVAADEAAEKEARTEFLRSIMPMLQTLIPQVSQNPAVAELIKALTMFGVRAFPAAKGLEEVFEQAFAKLAQTPPPPPEGKGNTKSPLEIAAEAKTAAGDQQVEAAKVQVDSQKNAVDMMKIYTNAQSAAAKLQQDQQQHAAELALQASEQQSRQQLEGAKLAHLLARDSAGLV